MSQWIMLALSLEPPGAPDEAPEKGSVGPLPGGRYPGDAGHPGARWALLPLSWHRTGWALGLLVLLIPSTGCAPVDGGGASTGEPADTPRTGVEMTNLPEQRAFAMGFAYQPYDWNEEAFAETARILSDHGDIVGIFYDGFIPWREAAAREPYHPNVESVLARRAAAVRDHHQVLVSTSILGGDRVSLSGYLGESDLPREGDWASRTFDDPEVIAAYLNWCRDLIRRFQPDYFVYVMEADAGLTDVGDPRFQSLLRAVQQIHPILRQEYPDLPLIVEFVLMNDEEMARRADVIEALLPYTDIYGVSTYPFLHAGGDPDDIQRDWFTRVGSIAPGMPFAVVETNHLAQDFEHPQGLLDPETGKRVLIPGREEWQARYLDFLFRQAQAMDAEFVIQWTSRDLDRLAERWRGTGAPFDPDIEPMGNVANDCGVYDENGRARPSLTVWQGWLEVPGPVGVR